MNESEQNLKKLQELELSSLSMFSITANRRFPPLLCDDARLHSRFFTFCVSSEAESLERARRSIEKKICAEGISGIFLYVFAFPGQRQGVKEEILSLLGEKIVLIDATAVPMDKSANESYAMHMGSYQFHRLQYDPEAEQYADAAYEELKDWADRVKSAPVTVYETPGEEGRRYESLNVFFEQQMERIKDKYPFAPDFFGLEPSLYEYRDAANYVGEGFYGQGGGALEEEGKACFARLKKHFEEKLAEALRRDGRVSFSEMFAWLSASPYGLRPNRIGAVIVGMLFKTLAGRGLLWTNGFQQDLLDEAHLLSMAESGIAGLNAPHRHALADAIMVTGKEEDAFYDGMATAFCLEREETGFSSDLIAGIRKRLEEYPCPAAAFPYLETGDTEKKLLGQILALITLSSEEAGGDKEKELLEACKKEILTDNTLSLRLQELLKPVPLREAFTAMLKTAGCKEPEITAETLRKQLDQYPQRKWIWQETDITEEALKLERN